MKTFSSFIDTLIPDRFKVTFEVETKVRGAIYVQLVFGSLLLAVGLFFWFKYHLWHELLLNGLAGTVTIAFIFALKRFDRFENYINLLLSIGYIDLAAFIIKTGGIYADAPFWFALLLAINIFYTSTRQSIFWIIMVTLFLGSLFVLEVNGLDLGFQPAPYVKKATTLLSFYVVLITIAFSFSKISKKKTSFHLETIAKHKRLLKQRDDLMSIIAHDLKSPARRIEGLLSVFDTQNLTKDQKDILKRIKQTALEGKELIDDLLVATSYQANVKIEPVVLNQLVRELRSGFLPLASKKEIRIITRGLRPKMTLETSSYQLRRILDNLLSNAIKFSPPGSRVEIICTQNAQNTSIAIQDQGPGFTPADEEKMFQMFQKLSAQPTGGESSTGLGLSIIKNLTELLHGQIKYVTQPGKGATFTLVLPNTFVGQTPSAT